MVLKHFYIPIISQYILTFSLKLKVKGIETLSLIFFFFFLATNGST
jgi:hypothetical protein